MRVSLLIWSSDVLEEEGRGLPSPAARAQGDGERHGVAAEAPAGDVRDHEQGPLPLAAAGAAAGRGAEQDDVGLEAPG